MNMDILEMRTTFGLYWVSFLQRGGVFSGLSVCSKYVEFCHKTKNHPYIVMTEHSLFHLAPITINNYAFKDYIEFQRNEKNIFFSKVKLVYSI
jgi:hypothetical protein